MRPQTAKKQAAYTLLELLVVIAVISIILTMTTLAVTSGSAKERLQTEVQRFNALLVLAQDESLLNATEMGIAVSTSGYQFLLLQENQWQPMAQDSSFRKRELPDDLKIELELDYQHTDLKSRVTKIGEVEKVGEVEKFSTQDNEQLKPQIYLLSSGELAPPFQLRFFISGADTSADITGTEDGDVKVEYHVPE
jgi:type II secretion system protein H